MDSNRAEAELERALAAWRAIAARNLLSEEAEILRHRSAEELLSEALDTRLTVCGEEGVPGIAPFIRGSRAAGQLATAGWESRQLHSLAAPEAVAEAIREDLAGGVRGIWLRLDRSDGATAGGVRIDSLPALETAIAPLDMTRHTLAFDPGPGLHPLALLWLARAPRTGKASWLSLGLDPLGAAALGELPSPAEALAQTAEVLPALLAELPGARLLTASGLPFHEAGATASQELACMIASAVTLLRHGERLGIAPEELAARLELRLAVDADVFTGAAKCRALRRLWSQVLAVAGIEARPFLHAVTSRRMLARVDPWTNILRLTAATAAGALGGADAITTLPFDEPLRPPDAFSRRLARNTQAILALESRLFQPVDAVGGSFYLQRLSDQLAREAWQLVGRIETVGGLDQALTAGMVQEWIAEARLALEQAVATRRQLLIGVSAFAALAEEPLEETSAPPIHRVWGERDGIDLAPMSLAAAIEALRAGARIKPIGATEPKIRVLRPFRLAEPFERLRDRAEAFRSRHGAYPELHLLCFGAPGHWVSQAHFAKNLFEAGGIRTREQPCRGDAEAAVTAVASVASRLCGVCGVLDAALEVQLCRQLRQRGVLRLYRFGASANAADYDASPQEGIDALALLADAWSALEEEER